MQKPTKLKEAKALDKEATKGPWAIDKLIPYLSGGNFRWSNLLLRKSSGLVAALAEGCRASD